MSGHAEARHPMMVELGITICSECGEKAGAVHADGWTGDTVKGPIEGHYYDDDLTCDKNSVYMVYFGHESDPAEGDPHVHRSSFKGDVRVDAYFFPCDGEVSE